MIYVYTYTVCYLIGLFCCFVVNDIDYNVKTQHRHNDKAFLMKGVVWGSTQVSYFAVKFSCIARMLSVDAFSDTVVSKS